MILKNQIIIGDNDEITIKSLPSCKVSFMVLKSRKHFFWLSLNRVTFSKHISLEKETMLF